MNVKLSKLAQKMDRLGKYAIADKIDDFIKTAQPQLPFFVGGPTVGLQGTSPSMFDPMAAYSLTAGPLSTLYSGDGAAALQRTRGTDVQSLATPGGALQFYKVMAGDPNYASAYMTAVGEAIGGLQTGTATANFKRLISYFEQRLDPLIKSGKLTDAKKVWSDISEVVSSFLTEVFKSEQNLNTVSQIVNIFQQKYSQLPEIMSTIGNSLNQVLIQLYMERSNKSIQRYNQLLSIPNLQPFVSQFQQQAVPQVQQQATQPAPPAPTPQAAPKTKKPIQQATDIIDQR